MFTQKRAQMDDQEAEGSHLNKKGYAAFLYLSQFSDSEPLTKENSDEEGPAWGIAEVEAKWKMESFVQDHK